MEYLIMCLSFISGLLLLALCSGGLIFYFKRKKGSVFALVGGIAVVIVWVITFLTTFQQLSTIFVNFQIILKIICVTVVYGLELLILNFICIKIICKNNRDEQKTAAGIGLFQGILLPIGAGIYFIINGINIAFNAFGGNIAGINQKTNMFITNNNNVINVYPFSDTLLDFISVPLLVIGICLCFISISVSVYSFSDKGKKLVLIPSLIIGMLMVTAVVTFIFISYNFTDEFAYKMITYMAIPLFFLIIGLANTYFQCKIYKK